MTQISEPCTHSDTCYSFNEATLDWNQYLPPLGICKNLHVFHWVSFYKKKVRSWVKKKRQDGRHLKRIRVALFLTFQYFSRLVDGGRATSLIQLSYLLWRNVASHMKYVCQQISIFRDMNSKLTDDTQTTLLIIHSAPRFRKLCFEKNFTKTCQTSFRFRRWWDTFFRRCFLQTCLTGLSTWQGKQGDNQILRVPSSLGCPHFRW